jgi:hypothetical protein
MKTVYFIAIIAALLQSTLEISAQDRTFNIDAYKQFVTDNEDISPAELYGLYPSGLFKDSVTTFDLEEVNFLQKIDNVYSLTQAEKSLLLKNGFVVTERKRAESFLAQYRDIYNNDLPVFISTDAMLHVFHASYDAILKDVELQFLIPKLKELLTQCHSKIKDLDAKYGQNPAMKPMLRDVDVYFTVPLILLGENNDPYYNENFDVINEFLGFIENESWETYNIFSDDCSRDIDFSQFKPRGHYTDSPELESYFRAMMWLGRIEIYIAAPASAKNSCDEKQMDQTVQRQIIDGTMIQEISSNEEITGIYSKMEEVISFFIGEQDNVTLNDLTELIKENGNIRADSFLVDSNVRKFQNILKTKPWSGQKILSQILISGSPTEPIEPASAFMLFGQRFVIDSYVTGQVVYDRIVNQGSQICRLTPSTLDVLFALGNDASTQLLIPELDEWKYSDNLAGLRYLIDQYPNKFWESSLYNMWLYTIKSLNPQPADENIPEFMQTGAWGMEKMNSQLSSWAELRHDNLLYAKQSYTGGGQCLYPEGYVEPNPVFYKRLKRMAEIAITKFSKLPGVTNNVNSYTEYFSRFYDVCDTLDMIVSKELNNQNLSADELGFINGLPYGTKGGCGGHGEPKGWYYKLYYGNQNPNEPEFLVADYHTTPTDCAGNELGWILHAGTGLVDMMISIVNTPDNQLCAYVGPVMSYHEYVSTNFLRLNDEEWTQTYLYESMRPDWVWNYLADTKGESNNAALKLFSNADELKKALKIDVTNSVDNQVLNPESLMTVYPNPMTNSTIISLNIPESQRNICSRLTLYDIQGKMIKILLDQNLSPGHYLTKWDRTNQSGNLSPSGMYILKLDQGNHSYATKIVVTD